MFYSYTSSKKFFQIIYLRSHVLKGLKAFHIYSGSIVNMFWENGFIIIDMTLHHPLYSRIRARRA